WQILQGLGLIERGSSVDQRGTTTGYDAFFKCCTSRGHSIFDASLALFELNLGCSTDLDDGDATGQFGQAFLQFFTVPVRVGCFDLGTDLGNTIGDVLCFTGAIHDGGGFLGDGDATCSTQHFQTHLIQLHAQVFRDDLCTGQGGDILKHGLAAVTEARGFDGNSVEGTAQFVHDQGRQGFAVNVFGDDEQWFLFLQDFFQQSAESLDVGGLGLGEENVWNYQHGFLRRNVSD